MSLLSSVGSRLGRAAHLAQVHVEAGVLAGALALPEPAQRRLVGKPVVRDGQTLATETQLLLLLQKLSGKPAETLPIPRGREVILHQSGIAGGRQKVGEVRRVDLGGLPGRLYVPEALLGGPGKDPTLVLFHGGGWIYGDLDSHDATARFLAEQAGVRVVAVDYRLAPENPFPAAYDDCVAAFRWITENAVQLGADADRLAVGGDSAGGNLAAVVALAAARQGLPLKFQLLVYPACDMTRSMESHRTFKEGFFLTKQFMDLAAANYLPNEADRTDPRASPLFEEEIPGNLAPAYLCTAGFDPLRDEGEAYARKLVDAGVEVEMKRFPDQIHGFFNVVGVGRTSRACVAELATKLRAGLA